MTRPQEHDTETGKNGAEPADHPWERELASYPLRDAAEDPRWAVRLARGWLWTATATGLFVLVLILLGIFYD